jgi:hypothetical protein
MLSGLPLILAMAAQAAEPASAGSYGPAEPPKPRPAAKDPAETCKTTEAKDVKEDTSAIVVCAQRIEGYRIDPDVLSAERHAKNRTKPRRPERLVDNSCASVGPMGCTGQAGINLLAAAVTAATMVEKAVTGQNVGKMFVTDPQPSEYELYQEAKRAREAKEAEEAAAAKAKAEPAGPTAQPK